MLNLDYWFVRRQLWIAQEAKRLQCTEKAIRERLHASAAIRRLARWVALGFAATVGLLLSLWR